jgi:hypothetical protein
MEQTTQTTALDNGSTAEDYTPRQMTLGENLILTGKLVAVAAAVLGVLWGAGQWTSPR